MRRLIAFNLDFMALLTFQNTELAVFMSSMGLDGPSVVPSPEDHVRLPQELIEVAAKLSVSSDSKVRLMRYFSLCWI